MIERGLILTRKFGVDIQWFANIVSRRKRNNSYLCGE